MARKKAANSALPPARRYPQSDIKILFGQAAGRCAFPDCREPCVLEATARQPAAVIGKIAHIVAHSGDGPRGDSKMTADERDRYDNWILLCGTCHDKVDRRESTYTVSELRRLKVDHERWVRERLSEAVPRVSSAELEIVTRALLGTPMAATTNFVVVPPAEKMRRNGLTDRVTYSLMLGLAAGHEVAAFLRDMCSLDPDFPERLRSGFVKEYEAHRKAGLVGDALFEAMADTASRGFETFEQQAAGLGVLAYLFEACEVFER